MLRIDECMFLFTHLNYIFSFMGDVFFVLYLVLSGNIFRFNIHSMRDTFKYANLFECSYTCHLKQTFRMQLC